MKFVAAFALVFGLGWMWDSRDDVVSAYAGERSVEALSIEPLTFSAATIPPDEADGAMRLAEAPNTGDVRIEPLAFVELPVESPKVNGGSSTLQGSVLGLAAEDVAQVRITRITDGGQDEISVPVEEDGTWIAEDINGGRYRVRAFVPGLRASNGSVVLFLNKGQSRDLQLKVTTPPQNLVFDVVATEEPAVGGRSVVAITVGRQLVDSAGRSVLSPVVGTPVTASFSPVVSLLSANSVATSEGGAARFLVRCELEGTSSVTVSAEEQVAVLTIPACVAPAPEPAPESPATEGGGDDG